MHATLSNAINHEGRHVSGGWNRMSAATTTAQTPMSVVATLTEVTRRLNETDTSPASCIEDGLKTIPRAAAGLMERVRAGSAADSGGTANDILSYITALSECVVSAAKVELQFLVLIDIAKQRWHHVQPYMKDTRTTPGVNVWYLYQQRLASTILRLVSSAGPPSPATEIALMLGYVIGMVVIDETVMDVCELYETLKPSRARTVQYFVDVMAVTSATLALIQQWHVISIRLLSRSDSFTTQPPGADAPDSPTGMAKLRETITSLLVTHTAACHQHLARLLCISTIICGPAKLLVEHLEEVRIGAVKHLDFVSPTARPKVDRVHGATVSALSSWLKPGPSVGRWALAATAVTKHERFEWDGFVPVLKAFRVIDDTCSKPLAAMFEVAKSAFESGDGGASDGFPWPVLLAPVVDGHSYSPLDKAELVTYVRTRHELCEWQWPLLTSPQVRFRTVLESCLEGIASDDAAPLPLNEAFVHR